MAKILVIDDVEETRNSMRRTLELNGFDVLLAGNGLEALEKIEEFHVDAIITDVFMPDMEGIETIRHLRGTHPEVPIVVMTGAVNDVFVNIGLKLGAVCSLSKPFSTEQLLAAVDVALVEREKLCPELRQ